MKPRRPKEEVKSTRNLLKANSRSSRNQLGRIIKAKKIERYS